jgi:hypothetical protein
LCVALIEGQKENKKRKKERQRMKKAIVLLVVALLVFLMVSMCCLVHGGDAEVGVVGVKPGDWVKYKVTKLGSSFAWIEKAVWVKVEVLNVSSTTVTTRETIHHDDGSEWVSNSSYDLHQYVYASNRYIIAANLGPGDKVGEYPMWRDTNETVPVYVDLILNNTDYRSYDGVTREVNQLKYSRLWKDGFAPYFINGTLEKYWDKCTGFVLEWKIQECYIPIPEEGAIGKECSSTYWMEIVDTNMWEMQKPQQSFLWLAAIPVGAVIVAVATIKLRNNRKKNEDDKQ